MLKRDAFLGLTKRRLFNNLRLLMKNFSLPVLGVTLVACSAVPSASASIFVDLVPAPPVSGTQNYGGSLGLDFDVGLDTISVTRLGVFDDDQDGLNLTITAYIYDRNTQTPVIGPLVFTGTTASLEDGFRFLPITPFTLPAGFKGSVVAEGYGDSEQNGNFNTNGPDVTFSSVGLTKVGNRFGSAGSYPGGADAGNGDPTAGEYAAGNFDYTVVPEPATAGVLSLGSLVLFARRRRR